MTEHVDDVIAAYALDALPPPERQEVEAHLRSCAYCRIQAGEAFAIVDVLPLALEPVQPPARLRERILSEAARDAAPVRLVHGKQAPSRLGSFARRLLQRQIGFSPAAALVAAVLVLAIGIAVGHLVTPQGPTSEQRYAQRVAQAVAHGDTVRAFQSTGRAVRGSIVLDVPHTGNASLIIGGLNPPPAGKVYQVWFITNPARPTSAGVFNPGHAVPTVRRLRIPAGAYHIAALTVEPGPHGSVRPTTQPVLVTELG